MADLDVAVPAITNSAFGYAGQKCSAESRVIAPGTVLDDQLTVACGVGAARILELQRAGKHVMKAADFLRGSPIGPGAVLR